jgi:Cu+-exporting ATPase
LLVDDVLVLFLDSVGRTWSITRVEPMLNRVRGVRHVSVSLATEKARITFDPTVVNLHSLVQVIRSCGCDVRTKQATIRVRGINSSSYAMHTAAALCKVPGVVDAWVDVATESAIVSYLAGHTTPDRLGQAIRGIGYEPGEIATSDSERNELLTKSGRFSG